METLFGKHWHHMPADEVLDILQSDSEKGLDLFEVQERRTRSVVPGSVKTSSPRRRAGVPCSAFSSSSTSP